MKKDLYKITDLIYREFLGELSEEERNKLYLWIDRDDRHKRYYEKLFTGYSLDKIKSLDEADTAAAWKKWDGKYRNRRSVRYYLQYAAVFVLLVGVASWLYFKEGQKVEAPRVVAEKVSPGGSLAILTIEGKKKIVLGKNAPGRLGFDREINAVADSANLFYESKTDGGQAVMHTLEVPRRGEFFIMLSDSTRVWINSASRLRYPSFFEGKERVVELEGEAYFEVSEDRAKPFIVRTRGIEVEVLGTCFNVTSYGESPDILTTLVAGKVKVHVSPGKGTGEIVLLPGMQSVYNRETGSTEVRHEVNTRLYTAWTRGYFMYENARLEDIMREICRWYNAEVVFGDKEAREMEFTGEFRRYDSFGQVLNFLRLTKKVDVKTDGNVIYIKSL